MVMGSPNCEDGGNLVSLYDKQCLYIQKGKNIGKGLSNVITRKVFVRICNLLLQRMKARFSLNLCSNLLPSQKYDQRPRSP